MVPSLAGRSPTGDHIGLLDTVLRDHQRQERHAIEKSGMQQRTGMEVLNDGISDAVGASAVHLRVPQSRTLAAVWDARSYGARDRFCGADRSRCLCCAY